MVNGQIMVTCFYYRNLRVKQVSNYYLGASAAWSSGKCWARGIVVKIGGDAGELSVVGELSRRVYAAWPATCQVVSPPLLSLLP